MVQPPAVRKTVAEELLMLLLHFPLALLGGALIAYFVGGITVRIVYFISGVDSIREIWSPFYWFWNVLFGFLVNLYALNRSAPWLALLALIYMTAMVLWDVSVIGHSQYYLQLPGGPWRYEWNQLFTSKCSDSECLGELFITAPTLALVSYSVGAWLGMRTDRNLVNSLVSK